MTATEDVAKDKPFGEEEITITDTHLSEEVWGSYQGFKFICPICEVPSIMINKDIIPICLKCGRKVKVDSPTVQSYLSFQALTEARQNTNGTSQET